MTQSKCEWLACRKPLGVTVWRISKFSNHQFCSEACCIQWHKLEKRNKEVRGEAQEYRKLLHRHPILV